MSTSAIIIQTTVGRLAAFLTATEFFLGTIAVLCLRPLLSGIWLYRLHRNGRAPIRERSLSITSRREVLGVTLAGFFALAVFLVEKQLTPSYNLTSQTSPSLVCVDLSVLDRAYPDFLLDIRRTKPPSRFLIDRASIDIVDHAVDCPGGLAKVDFGSDALFAIVNNGNKSTEDFEDNDFILAPTCNIAEEEEREVLVPPPIVPGLFLNPTEYAVLFDQDLPFLIPRDVILSSTDTAINTIVDPSNSITISGGPNRISTQPSLPIISECLKRNLSSMPSVPMYQWELRDVSSLYVAHAVQARICQSSLVLVAQENDTQPQPLQEPLISIISSTPDSSEKDEIDALVRECVRTDDLLNQKFTASCLRAFAEKRGNIGVYVATLEHMNVLGVAVQKEDEEDSESQALFDNSFATACVDATVDYEFVVVPDVFLSELKVGSTTSFVSNGTNIVIPTRVIVRSSSSSDGRDIHCERTIHALGLSALIYSARVTWRLSSTLSSSSIHTPGDDFNSLPFVVDRTTGSDVTQRLSNLSPRQSFHAYTVAIAKRYFPIEAWKQPPYDSCPDMRVVGDGTRIAVNTEFYLLVVTMGLCFVLVVIALWFWLRLPKQAWRVATATESLATLRYSKGSRGDDDCSDENDSKDDGKTQKGQATNVGDVRDGNMSGNDEEQNGSGVKTTSRGQSRSRRSNKREERDESNITGIVDVDDSVARVNGVARLISEGLGSGRQVTGTTRRRTLSVKSITSKSASTTSIRRKNTQKKEPAIVVVVEENDDHRDTFGVSVVDVAHASTVALDGHNKSVTEEEEADEEGDVSRRNKHEQNWARRRLGRNNTTVSYKIERVWSRQRDLDVEEQELNRTHDQDIDVEVIVNGAVRDGAEGRNEDDVEVVVHHGKEDGNGEKDAV